MFKDFKLVSQVSLLSFAPHLHLYSSFIISYTLDDEGTLLVTDLLKLPARKKHPWYYQVIEEPIDLSMINNRILSGAYTHVDMFEKDVMTLISNVEVNNNTKVFQHLFALVSEGRHRNHSSVICPTAAVPHCLCQSFSAGDTLFFGTLLVSYS